MLYDLLRERVMNHHYQKTLQALFAHPLHSNIDFKDVEHLLTELGAGIEQKNGNKIAITLNGQTFFLHRPHGHSLPKDEVAQVRDFLTACGIAPENAT